jgi:spermidine/putrescine-binding protein
MLALSGGACHRTEEPPYPGPGEKKLNLYIWSEYLPKEVIDEFTRRTGIAVSYDLYDSNEPVLEKLQSGVAAYDLVVPSDYMVRILIQLKLLRPLDKARLKNFGNLDPRFLDQEFDPGNGYSIPYVWGTTGYGYDKQKVGKAHDSWAPLFDPANRGQILMLDDMRECFAVALKHLGHSLNSTDPAVLKQAADLLKKQKPLVKTYNSSDYENILASGDVTYSHGYNGQLAKLVAKDPVRFAYVLPKEGATIWMDSVCLPARARNVESIYAFLDYILEPEVNARIVNGISYASANVPARRFIRPEILNDVAIYPPPEALSRCEFVKDIGDATTILDEYWTEIKAQ